MCPRVRALPSGTARAYGPANRNGQTTMQRIDAKTLHGWIADGQELALLDAREDGEFGASHLFWAVPCGLAQQGNPRPRAAAAAGHAHLLRR